MRNWIFHSLNIIVLIIFIVPFNLFAWFGNAMSAVSSPGVNFSLITTFVWWGAFYFIQFRKEKNTWRITWFIISLIVLGYWMFGGGFSLWNFMFD